MPMLLVGCDGGTNAVAGIAPKLTRRLVRAGPRGSSSTKLGECRSKCSSFSTRCSTAADFPEGVRAAVDLLGFRTGSGRQPLGADQQAGLHVLRTKLAR